MSSIDKVPARTFFAELLLPLKYANARRNVHYLQCSPMKPSTWEPVASRTGGMEKLSASSCTGPALLEVLRRYWAKQNDSNLVKLLPYLVALREELLTQTPADDKRHSGISDFVYPLF